MSYTLLHGDCLDLMATLPDASVDLVVTDAAYKIASGGNTTKRMMGGIFHPDVYDNSGEMFATVPFDAWMPDAERILKPDADCYVMVNDKNMRDALNAAYAAGFKLHNILIWDKGNVTPNRWYMKGAEFTLYLWKGKARNIVHLGSPQINRTPNIIGTKCHPTEKPVSLMEHYITNSSSPGAVVLDMFMGSGTTGVACLNTGRRFIGIERDAGYFASAAERIAAAAQSQKAAA